MPPTGHSVLVLGATGGLGRTICRAFARAGYTVRGAARRPSAGFPGADFYALDLASAGPASPIAGALARSDTVVNVTGSWSRDQNEMKVAHIRLVERITSMLAEAASRPRFVHVGTIHEYGTVPDGTAIGEQTPVNPQLPYGRTKLAGSQVVLRAAAAGQIDGVILRVANVFGPDTSAASFLGALAARLRETDPAAPLDLAVSNARRDYVDVRDVAAAVLAASRAPVTGEVINIGRGQALNLGELVDAMVAASGRSPETIRYQGPVASQGGGEWTQVDITLARRLLGWAPRYTMSESIGAMVSSLARIGEG